MSRSAIVPVFTRKRSAKVDLPWSMCAIIQKFRISFIEAECSFFRRKVKRLEVGVGGNES